eukprot:TRINITY_DN4316_c0_g1_i2.p1 TRINITY_DN4316_c0_g1~~TRINITY_DN4316_c0_g1_i2.p1  ORF type:complete len:218 (+),score=27.36 TRINITY_DN4316_c0_g1_i2:57-710(+)
MAAGGLLLYVRVAGRESAVPVDVDPMATVQDVRLNLQKLLKDSSAFGHLSFGGEVLSDPSALLADIGVCAESVLDWSELEEPTDDNVLQVRVSGLGDSRHVTLSDSNGVYDRLTKEQYEERFQEAEGVRLPVAGTRQHERGVLDVFVQVCTDPQIPAGLLYRKAPGERWKLTVVEAFPFTGWYPSHAVLLGQWEHNPSSDDAMAATDAYPEVVALKW